MKNQDKLFFFCFCFFNKQYYEDCRLCIRPFLRGKAVLSRSPYSQSPGQSLGQRPKWSPFRSGVSDVQGRLEALCGGRAARAVLLCSLSAEWKVRWLPCCFGAGTWRRGWMVAKPGVTSVLALLLVVTLPPPSYTCVCQCLLNNVLREPSCFCVLLWLILFA